LDGLPGRELGDDDVVDVLSHAARDTESINPLTLIKKLVKNFVN
jgi:hypothetical protein